MVVLLLVKQSFFSTNFLYINAGEAPSQLHGSSLVVGDLLLPLSLLLLLLLLLCAMVLVVRSIVPRTPGAIVE